MSEDGGIGRLERRLAAIPKAIVAATEPALMKSANELADTMRRLVPKDTHALEESIAVTGPGAATPPYSQPGGSMVVPENAAAVTAGNEDVRYAHLVEYGTAEAHAQPYFWPSVRLNRNRAVRRIRRAISTAVRKSWGIR